MNMDNHYNCIYMYINKINNKRYIGQTIDFNRRHKEHINTSYNKNQKGYNSPFHKAIRKHNINNFDVIILRENLSNQCLLDLYECYYIKKYDTLAKNKNGYNVSDGGYGGNKLAGKTEEEKEKIFNDEKRNKKISDALKGVPKTKEHKEKQSEIMKNKYKHNKHHMYGKHLSEETKQKIRDAHKGKTCAEETKQKISKSNKNRKFSDDHKEKISEQLKGKNKSKKSIEKRIKTIKEKDLLKGKNNPRARKVDQYDLNGNLIKIWDYAKQVSKELNINYITLNDYLNGRRKTNEYKGYIWKYHEEIE